MDNQNNQFENLEYTSEGPKPDYTDQVFSPTDSTASAADGAMPDSTASAADGAMPDSTANTADSAMPDSTANTANSTISYSTASTVTGAPPDSRAGTVDGTAYNDTVQNQNPSPNYAYTYIPSAAAQGSGAESGVAAKKGMPTWVKVLLIIGAILIFAVLLSSACSRAVSNFLGSTDVPADNYVYSSDYIGVLYLEGTITEGESGDGYNHNWMLQRIDDMASDPLNQGILMSINTPGGSAYASRELYLALMDYKQRTDRPIYMYLGSQATSGGYYAAVAGDRIFANEECWTGSIGVVISGLYDFSGLFEKYGVKAENIVSGRNKDMGTNIKPMTDEQREIFQSLVDDTFDRFVEVVALGRNLSDAKVRELADGRIYTANQAVENGLIDAIGTIDEALAAMQEEYDLESASPQVMQYIPPSSLRDYLGLNSFLSSIKGDSEHTSDIDGLIKLLENTQSYELLCIAPIKK